MEPSSEPPGIRPAIAEILRPHRLYWGSSRGIICGPLSCGWTPTNEVFAHEEWCDHIADVIIKARRAAK